MTRLSFEMWVSLPNQMDQALHIYSRLQSSNAASIPMQLDDVKNWRSCFPSLRPIVDNWSLADGCDIILLEASFRLMSDFPPKFSKLGISLELDFLHSSNNNGGSLAALHDWSCRTYMYRNGRLVKEVSHDDCHVAGVGKIKPFFESKWWASTFTQHTERRKMAEDSKNDAAIALANDHSRNFFRGLTVMQEISAQPSKVQSSHRIWTDHPPPQKRMAILLWKFSQAPDDFVGTTTWQKVLPPSERFLLNRLAPLTDLNESALTLDSIMGSSDGDNIFSINNAFMPTGNQQQDNLFHQESSGSQYQDDFMDYRVGSMASFEDATFGLQTSQTNLDNDMNVVFDMQSHCISQLQSQASLPTTNFFELPQLPTGIPGHKNSIHSMSQQDSLNEHDGQIYYQPLAKFDMSTHKILQAQLGTDDDPNLTEAEQHVGESPSSTTEQAAAQQFSAYLDEDDEALRAALLAASAMNEMGNPQPGHQPPMSSDLHKDPLYIASSHPFASPSTLAVRPPLHTHHSFAGTSNIAADHSFPSHGRQSSKTDFASMLANLQAYNSNHDISHSFDLGTGVSYMHDQGAFSFGIGISRPQSQPVLLATATDALYEEIMGHLPATSTHAQIENRHDADEQNIETHGRMDEELPEDGGFVVVSQEARDSKESLEGLIRKSGYVDLGNG